MFWRRKRRTTGDFAEEIRSHIELEADQLKAGSISEAEARTAARKSFGNVTIAEERFHEKGRIVWFHDLLQDVRYGLRAMRQNPGFTAAAVLTLALGMGANTAIFSLIDAVLLRSLPVHDPASLYFLNNAGTRGANGSPPYPCFERFRAEAKSFTGIAAFANQDYGIRIDGPVEQIDGVRVSGNYYGLLGLTPFAGRLLTESDEKLDPPAAVISYPFWQRRFGGNLDAIGKTFYLDEHKFTIVGITPKDFYGLLPGHSDDVTMPISIAGPKVLRDTGSWWFNSVARLKPGVSAEQAHAEIEPIFQGFMTRFPQPAEIRRILFDHMEVVPASHGLDALRRRFSRPLWALMAVVGLVLLIACCNITNLLLARAAKREREFAVRVAIGAGRARLCRQLLVETGLLFATGALSGLALAWWAARGVAAFFSTGTNPIQLDMHWDWRVIAFTSGLSLLATFIFGAAPILRAMNADPHASMKDGGRATRSRSGVELGQFLVAFQVGLSVILLVGAALFLRTLTNLHSVNAGFRAGQVALISLHLPDPTYKEKSSRLILWDRLLADVRSVPGVQSASLSWGTPLDGRYREVSLEAPGFQSRSSQESKVGFDSVSEDYFATLGTPLLQGRAFTERDRAGTPGVAVLNESAARHFFGSLSPVGSLVKVIGGQYQIVGVVRDAREVDLRQEPHRIVYVPVRQTENARLTLCIRTAADPTALMAQIQRRLQNIGPDIHVVHTGTLAQQVDESLLQERLISTLATAFGVLALVLSAVGLYGVLAYSVARRIPEIGIRLALGAMPGQVIWSILRQTLWLVAIGLAAGVPVSIFLAKLVENMFYGVTPGDLLTQVCAAGLLAVVALVASFLPARRAGRIDPLAALRYE